MIQLLASQTRHLTTNFLNHIHYDACFQYTLNHLTIALVIGLTADAEVKTKTAHDFFLLKVDR